MDTIALKAASLASPKIVKNAKGAIVPSSQMAHVAEGCEHMGEFLEKARKMTLANYRNILQRIHDLPSIIAQTHKGDGRSLVSLRPTYLCLQCPTISTEAERDQHGESKAHCFSVESRHGHIYCGRCLDFIYDPELEGKRLQKGKKRKQEDLVTTEDHKVIISNSTFLPCRAIGLRGLYNMGQTCFMSVVLQTLVHNPFVRNFYLMEGHKKEDCGKEGCVSCALDEMVVEFHSSEKTEGFGAVNMLMGSWLAGDALAGYQQQDAHEYMNFILNTLHIQNDGASENDCNCIIHETFYGKLASTVICDNCKNAYTKVDPYMDLSLDVRNQAKKRKLDPHVKEEASLGLRDCLERFTTREKLSGDYTCPSCEEKQSATKQFSIKSLPPFLPIHLKRFDYSKSASSKIETRVSFPMKLDLFPYTTQYKSGQTKASKLNGPPNANHNMNTPANSHMYELASVIVHKGKMDSGHYVSYSREENEWFLFDDSKVVLVPEADVLAAEAYILFYMVSGMET